MEQVRELLKRLHVPGAVGKRAFEYFRLAEVKCSSHSLTPSCLAIVCIELACVQLGEPLDKKQAQRLSGVPSKQYLSAYQIVEKVLNVSSQLSHKDLCVRFGCLEAQGLAEEILERYKHYVEGQYTAAQKDAIDLTKALFLVTSLYCACKLLKIRCDKSKFQEASGSSRSVFQNVLDEMNKCAPENVDNFKSKKRKRESKHSSVSLHQDNTASLEQSQETRPSSKKSKRETLYSRLQSDPTSEEYLKWKENIIRSAKTKLATNS